MKTYGRETGQSLYLKNGQEVQSNQLNTFPPLFGKILPCIIHYFGVNVAEKILLGWQILGIWNLEDPRLDVLIKVLKGREIYQKYEFLKNYDQEIQEIDNYLSYHKKLKSDIESIDTSTAGVEELAKLMKRVGLGTTIKDFETLVRSGYLDFNLINEGLRIKTTHKQILEKKYSDYTTQLSAILSKKISGISPRLLKHIAGNDTLPTGPGSIYYWQNPFSDEEPSWEQLDGALKYAQINAEDYFIEELVEKYFKQDWLTIYNKYRGTIFDRASMFSEKFEANIPTKGYNFADIIKEDVVTSKLEIGNDTLEKIGYVLLDRHQAKVNKQLLPTFIAVFKSTLSHSDLDLEEDIGAFFSNTDGSPISAELLDTVIIPHTDKKDFNVKLAWLMKRLGFSKVQIEKVPLLTSTHIRYSADMTDI